MDCRLFERQVQLNIDGLLSAKEREEMLQHAQVCPSCAAFLQDMTELSGMLTTRLRPMEPPAGFSRAVMAALAQPSAKQAPRPKVRRRPIWWRFGAVAAAAALLLAVGLHNIGPSQPGGNQNIIHQNPSTIIASNNPNSNTGLVDSSKTNPSIIDPLSNPNHQGSEPNAGLTGDVVEEPGDDNTEKEPETPVKTPIIASEPTVADIGDDSAPFLGFLDLPLPADRSLPSTEGAFSLTVLAIYEDCYAILPSITEAGVVEFYTKYKNKNHKWAQTLDAEEDAVHLEEVKALPTIAEIMGSVEESAAAGFSRVTAASPDGRNIAVNQAGEQPGIWLHKKSAASAEESLAQIEQEPAEPGLQIAAAGGGKILSWSPDSNKLIFTDNTGKLFVYYIFEKRTQLLYNGTVSCASWAKDSKMVVFSGKMEKKANSAIHTIIVP